MVAINDIAQRSTAEVVCRNGHHVTRLTYTFEDSLRDSLVLVHVICSDWQRPMNSLEVAIDAPALPTPPS